MRTAMAPLTADVAAATAAVVAAEQSSRAKILSMRLQNKGGIINPADKAELDALKAAALIQRKAQLKL
jgi:regulator of protease activity HflC (stomatin/prohibitin superfamily)